MPPWVEVAESFIGLKEIKGPKHNKTILGWLRDFGKNIGRWGKSRDETPWCAVFVSHCLAEAGFNTTESALAASYRTYGKPSSFEPGSIIVIKRRRKGADKATGSRAGYHVGFLIRATHGKYFILGGNQRNKVSRAWYPKTKYEVKACRWPLGAYP